jgi:tRNA/tmRNA/rRNA uracil-C5-methylase (TrmA/RlmC/RlmD family)
MDILEIQAYIDDIEKNAALYEEKNFDQRMEIEDFLGLLVPDRPDQPDQLSLLHARTVKVRSELEEIDKKLFQQLREGIRRGRYRGKEFKNLIHDYVDFNVEGNEQQEDMGYDNLDAFINGLSLFQPMPEQTKALEPEMVYYQKTPARTVFELVEKVSFGKEDVFFDLGSGLGQVAILVNLLAGITVRGIEFEPAFCDYAMDCAADLNLSNVTFINIDARAADFSEGTIFFMFTPFKGEILQAVLAALKKESLQRKIKIITYGPCTVQVGLQNWLEPITPLADNIYSLAVFSS